MRSVTRSAFARPLRDRLGRWLHGRIDAVATVRAKQEIAAAMAQRIDGLRLVGPAERLHIAESATVGDALLDTSRGSIVIEEGAELGRDVAVLTDERAIGQIGGACSGAGADVVIGRAARVHSRATLVAPCIVGVGAVVLDGAVVAADVPALTVVAGNPARIVGRSDQSPTLPPAVRIITEVGTLFAHREDEIITPALRAHGCWEKYECELFESELAPGAVAVDVGANIGYTTIIAGRSVGPSGTVIAVEPHPGNVALLQANIQQTGVADRVRVVAAAAWDSEGTVRLAVSPTNTGDHRVEANLNERSTVSVKAIRLDDAVPETMRVSVIKLDTQGTEHRVLRGARRLLERDRPVLLTEFWPRGIRDRGDDPHDVLAFLDSLDYELEVPDDEQAGALGWPELIARIDGRADALGGFATLRLRPRQRRRSRSRSSSSAKVGQA